MGGEEVKKILGLTIAVVLIIGLVAGGTWAYFSDTETTTDNTFTAGTIDLSLDPTSGQAVEMADGSLELKPCQTGFITITLTNDGTNPMDVWKMITTVSCAENGTVEPEQDWYDANPGELTNNQKNDIDTVIIYDMWIEVGGDPLVCEPGSGDLMIVNETAVLHIDDIDEFYIYLGTIASGNSITIVQSYHMDANTENWAQSDKMTFTMEFFAQQTEGDPAPPPPDFELTGYTKALWPH